MPEQFDEATTASEGRRDRGVKHLTSYLSDHKVDACLLATRIMTMFFALSYFLPIFGSQRGAAYYKAFMSSAATSALRMHQRIPRVSLNREFLFTLILEDSAHYLMFNLMFLFSDPISVALMPITMFALLHSASFSLTLLDILGVNKSNWWLGRFLVSLVELRSRAILRTAAFTEIFLMPLTVLYVFSGRVSLLTPFLYYRFLGLRYSSRRNPYTRAVFYELRVSTEQMIASPRMPSAVRGLVQKGINIVSNLAPAFSN